MLLRLDDGDVRGVRALGARLGVVGHLGALGQGLEARAVDAGVVDEQVLAAVLRRNEAEALLVAEPLHGSGGHCVTSAGHVNCDRGVLPMATPAALNTSFARPSMGLALTRRSVPAGASLHQRYQVSVRSPTGCERSRLPQSLGTWTPPPTAS